MFPNIKAEMARNNLTSCELAHNLNVSRKTIGNWLKYGNIPANALIKMAEIFEVSVDYLLGRTDN